MPFRHGTQPVARVAPGAPRPALTRASAPPVSAIRYGNFTSVKDLIAAIENFIDGWNDAATH